jgi:hypothetical protein
MKNTLLGSLQVRSCAVRAVGNFVRLVTEDMMNKSDFRQCTDEAIAVLVRNATKGNNMKVWQQDLLFVCVHHHI